MNILSWNVLLRDHAEKYSPESEILSYWPHENYRENKIINILKIYSDNNSIIALQEVSSSLLEKLKTSFNNKSMFTYQISDNEYLVTITPESSYVQEPWIQNEIANGYLVVKKDKLLIINTHLIPQRYTKYNVLKYILNLPSDMNNIVAGDFNENWKKVNISLESKYKIPFFGNTYKKRQFDHIIFDKNLPYNYSINHILCENVSDHNLIKIIFEPF